MDNAVINELRQLGLDAQADFYGGRLEQYQHHVWPENWPAFECFMQLSDQWIIAPFGGAIGLNGSVVLSYLDMLGINGLSAKSLYNDIRQIASGALKAWREKSEIG